MNRANALADDLDYVLARTEGLWREMRDQRLFITGGTGFFGRWLLETFVWANDRLDLHSQAVVLSRRPGAFAGRAPHLADHPAVLLLNGDVRDFAFPDGPFSHVIHAATDANPQMVAESPLTMFDTIVNGTRRVLEFSRRGNATAVLFASSGAVYGRQPADIGHVAEGFAGAPDPTDPRSAYGEGKRAAELLGCIHARSAGFRFGIARCFAFVGPFLPLDGQFAVGNFIRDALAGGPVCVNGHGTPFRSYLYAADLAVWLWTILFRGESCRPYNVGSGEAVSIREVAKMVANSSPVGPVQVEVAFSPSPGRPPERYVPDVRRATEELGLSVGVALPDAIRRTIQWHLGSAKGK